MHLLILYSRGKKVYKRFDDAGDEEEVIDPEELGLLARRHGTYETLKPLKTLTRKSIRPRRLFQDPTNQLDEEAETEIEDNDHTKDEDLEEQEQPSPSRSTRSQTKKVSNSGGSKKTSPFDSWPRLKSGSRSSSTRGRKRTAAEALEV